MKAKVISVHSGSLYPDGRSRITLQVEGAELMNSQVRIPNSAELQLDDEVQVEFTLLPVMQA